MGGAPSVDGCARRPYELVGVAMWAGMCINSGYAFLVGVAYCTATPPTRTCCWCACTAEGASSSK